jgi:hypothetical protein
VAGKAVDPFAEKQVNQWWQQRQGDQDRGDQGEGLGVRQRLEQLAFGAFHGEHRQKADYGRQHGDQDRASNFGAGAENDIEPRFAPLVPRPTGLAPFALVCLPQLSKHVLAQNDAHVDDRADRNRDSRESDDVGIDSNELHADERQQNGAREHQRNQKGPAQVKNKQQDDDDGDEDFLDQRRVQRLQGVVDQPRAIVEGHNGDLADRAVFESFSW